MGLSREGQRDAPRSQNYSGCVFLCRDRLCLRWIRRAAIALALMHVAYILASALILMQSADMSLRDVGGANFVLAGFLAIVSALTIAVLAGSRSPGMRIMMLFPAALILTSSVLTSHAMARLELRLPSENKMRDRMSWIWPACFVLIGLLLLNYREM
ncbi:MAG TPA: hypothetical protein VKP61_00820 [Candidatus Acidoferrum sp.]|nr:hypothetical protein [Candidatus Acidoferrum sp.]